MVAKAVEESSVTEVHPEIESSTGTPILDTEPSPTPATTVGIDEATNATSDEKAQSTAVSTSRFLSSEWSDRVMSRARSVSPQWSQKLRVLVGRYIEMFKHMTRQYDPLDRSAHRDETQLI